MTLCACGCGLPTSIARQTSRRDGHTKGESLRYLHGHNSRDRVRSRRDLTGQRFGRLLVVERAGSNHSRNATWLCRCDCGTETIVVDYSLVRGTSGSCGCWARKVASARGRRQARHSVAD